MRTPYVAAAIVALALAVGACGDDDSEEAGNGGNGGGGGGGLSGEGSGGGGQDGGGDEAGGGGQAGGGATRLELAADAGGELAFDETSLRAKPGRVTIAFDNPAQIPHAVEVEGMGVEEETETVTGGSARLTVNLEAGEYKFYCPVGNHEQAGMVGTLTVR
jgi:plastocyanin